MSTPAEGPGKISTGQSIYIDRELQQRIERSLSYDGCAILIGPYEVGKTRLANSIKIKFGEGALYFDGRIEADRKRLSREDGPLLNSEGKLIIIDEVQHFPLALDLIHAEINAARDQGKAVGNFLILGSSPTDVAVITARRLGTRAQTHQLTPICWDELRRQKNSLAGETQLSSSQEVDATSPLLQPNDSISLERLWLRGGFPNSLFSESELTSFEWRERYVEALCARGYGHINPALAASSVREFLTRVAENQGEMLKNERFRAEQRGLFDHFEDVGLIRRLRPWHSNKNKRYEKERKVYIRDSGLLHCLLGRKSLDDLRRDSNSWGHSWEGFCIENLVAAAGPGVAAFHYREDGDETDLVLEFPTGDRWALEMKGVTSKITSGFLSAIAAVGAKRSLVVRPVPESVDIGQHKIFTLQDAIQAVRQGPI